MSIIEYYKDDIVITHIPYIKKGIVIKKDILIEYYWVQSNWKFAKTFVKLNILEHSRGLQLIARKIH